MQFSRTMGLKQMLLNEFYMIYIGSRDISVGIATRYGMDGPGIESRGERDFPHLSRPAHPASCTMGTGSFPGVKSRPGRDTDPSPPSSAVVIKG